MYAQFINLLIFIFLDVSIIFYQLLLLQFYFVNLSIKSDICSLVKRKV